ncbi:MAG: GNAT family N-acetyltransferase [Clostridiales bacterium]|nr:GNAT family N-acetyltransferase [Clostridiales bacterium]
MIRKFEKGDLKAVSEIWLSSNTQAHSFIPKAYWKNNLPVLKKGILNSESYVYETDGVVRGFIGINGDFIQGIFVDEAFRNRGIGKKLLNCAENMHAQLFLKVYEKNKKAYDFYVKNGFSVLSAQIDKETGFSEFVMLRLSEN